MTIFSRRPVPESLSIVFEPYGYEILDNEYRDLGVSEGWLERTGYFRNGGGRLVWTFKHRKLPPVSHGEH